ncbi:MAG: GNAT family N-acetyltransferase [Sphingobacteriales bacterium]|nr:MAG: GNAT family N-acetyltransferase [Sphingobacteriales bacterium]
MIHFQEVSKDQIWQIRHEVMYPDAPFESIKLSEDENGLHLGLIEDSKLISIVSVFEDGNSLQFRKFATLNAYQGKGYGSKLLSYIIELAQTRNAESLWCNARVNATGFYRKFGFEETDSRFSKDGYDFVVMTLNFKSPNQ